MHQLTHEDIHRKQLFRCQLSGVIVYFRKRWNKRYDAVDVSSGGVIRSYHNITLETIAQFFSPYTPECTPPLQSHLGANLDAFEADVALLTDPVDTDLHREVMRSIQATRANLQNVAGKGVD